MLNLICAAIIVLVVGYCCAMCAISDPGCFDDIKTAAKETKKYFVSVRGNIF